MSKFRESECDSVVAVGGGSAIDLAKVINLVAANGGNAEEYFKGKIARIKPNPLIAIPTTCGTGAEGSPFAVIKDDKAPKKRGIENSLLMPKTVILDPESLISLSREMIAATGMDAFAHILESHLSRTATVLTRLISRGLLNSIRNVLEKAISDRDVVSLEILQSIAFTARLLYPRTGLSIAHALSHPLGAHTNIHHGLAVAVFLGASLEFNLPACADLIRQAEEDLKLPHDNISLLSWIDLIIKNSGMEREIIKSLQGMNLPIEKIAFEALQSSNITSNPRQINVEDARCIVAKSLSKFLR